jgi:hypothetical protein
MMQTLEYDGQNPEYDFRVKISIVPSIRFIGRLCKCGRLKSYARKKGITPMLNLPETKLVYREAVLKARMNNVFDKKLGKTQWSVECRDNVKWITVYFRRDLLLLSTDMASHHDRIIKMIISMIETKSVSY